MTWVAWRQYRSELLMCLGILAALMAFLIPTGLDKHALFRDLGLGDCLDNSQRCMELRGSLGRSYDSARNIVTWFTFAPAIVAMMLAMPIVAEFEQRTHRLAWTQSITREHWLRAKLGMAFAGLVFFAALLTIVMTWWYQPFDRIDLVTGSDLGRSFDFEGIMPFSYTVFAFSLALAAGALSGRVLVAMSAAFVGFVALRVLALELLRQGITGIDYEVDEALSTRDVQHFWTYQAIEGAIFLSLTALLLIVAVWAIRRRVS